MKVFRITLLTFLFLLPAAWLTMQAQSVGHLQIVNNCADVALDTIDLYFNGGVIGVTGAFEDSNVVYHAATGFLTYPTDTAFTIAVNQKHSYGNAQSAQIYSFTFPAGTLAANEWKEIIISGTQATGLSFQTISNLDTLAFYPGTQRQDTAIVTMRFFDGVTDIPDLKIVYRNGAALFSNPASLLFGNSTADVSVPHREYEFQILSGDGSKNYGTYAANLSGLGGSSVVILCSGFLNIDSTDSASALNMYALLNTGEVINFPLETTGFQLLNNSPDPATDSLDIYVNNLLAFHNLGFRNATQELVFKAYATYNIGIAPKNSSSVADTFWNETFFFPRDTFFIATALGLRNPANFAPNPDGINTRFNVAIKSPAEFASASLSNFDFYMVNGVTDAPALNLQPQGGPIVFSKVDYAQQTNYLTLPSAFYTLNVDDTAGNILLNGFGNFLAFNAQSAVVLTSGFLNPAANNNGPSMGLFMAPTHGGPFIPLYSTTGIHRMNSAIAAAIFPNPASNQLHLLFSLTTAENVTLQISDVNGRTLKEVINETHVAGTQNMTIDVSQLGEGLYFARLVTSNSISNSCFAITR